MVKISMIAEDKLKGNSNRGYQGKAIENMATTRMVTFRKANKQTMKITTNKTR